MEIGPEVRLHPTVHAAISALQIGDKLTWLSCFIAAAKLFDNGKRSDFQQFTRESIGVIYFTAIEQADSDGRGVHGWLHTRDEKTVRAYFKFRLDNTAMCSRLDVARLEDDNMLPLLSVALHLAWQGSATS